MPSECSVRYWLRKWARRALFSPELIKDVVFDRYQMSSIKNAIRWKRNHIENGEVPLQRCGILFCELAIGGGFDDPFQTWSSSRGNIFKCNHEEADTRLIAHAAEAVAKAFNKISVMCQDTDVLLLLIHFSGKSNLKVWMIAGTAKKRKF